MTQLLIAGALLLLIWALWSKHPILRVLGRVITGLLTLASAALTVLLFYVGEKAHWTSDGPGMLAVMIGIVLFGFLAFLFGGLFLGSFRQVPSGLKS